MCISICVRVYVCVCGCMCVCVCHHNEVHLSNPKAPKRRTLFFKVKIRVNHRTLQYILSIFFQMNGNKSITVCLRATWTRAHPCLLLTLTLRARDHPCLLQNKSSDQLVSIQISFIITVPVPVRTQKCGCKIIQSKSYNHQSTNERKT